MRGESLDIMSAIETDLHRRLGWAFQQQIYHLRTIGGEWSCVKKMHQEKQQLVTIARHSPSSVDIVRQLSEMRILPTWKGALFLDLREYLPTWCHSLALQHIWEEKETCEMSVRWDLGAWWVHALCRSAIMVVDTNVSSPKSIQVLVFFLSTATIPQ